MANKVQFGLKNCYYAIATFSGTNVTYSTPVAIPGGVNLNLSAQQDNTTFYADDRLYYATVSNTGYEGDLEVAKVPDAMYTDVWGYTLQNTSKVLAEDAAVEPKHFALLFEISGDADGELYALYDCVAGRPAVASGTIQETKEPVTQSISIQAAPLADGIVLRRTTASTPTSTKEGWFSTVFTATT